MRRLDNIDLRLLRVFVTLAESGGFPAAQIVLNLSQPTLSTHIAALERALGGALCLRGRRGFRLTPFGEATLQAAQQLFSDIDAFQHRLSRSNSQLVGRIRIGVVDGVISSGQLGLQDAIRSMIGQAPDLYVDLRLGTPHELEQWIAEGRRDLVIGPFAKQAPGVIYLPLYRETHALYCGAGHPLFEVAPSELKVPAIEQCLFSVRGYRQLEDLYRVNHPRSSATVIHMEAQAVLILSGRFIGFLPRHIGDSYAARGRMRVLMPQTYQFFSPHFAAFRRTDKTHPLVQLLVQELQKRRMPDQAEKRRAEQAPAPRGNTALPHLPDSAAG